MSKSIFNISQELEDIFIELEENGGEITEELAERLAIGEEELREKLDNYRRYYSHLSAEAKTCKEEEVRIAKVRKTKENHAERLKAIMLDTVLRYGDSGKSGNRVITLPDSKLYTKGTKCVEIQENVALTLKDCFLKLFKTAWENDCLTEEHTDRAEVTLRLINKMLMDEHTHTFAELIDRNNHDFTIDDLCATNVKFEFSVNLFDLNGKQFVDLLNTYFNHEREATVSLDLSKTALKNRIENGEELSIANIAVHDSLVIK